MAKGEERICVCAGKCGLVSRTQLVFTWVLFFWLFSTTVGVFGLLDDGLNCFLSRLCFHLLKLWEMGAAHALLCQLQAFYQRPVSPCRYYKSFLIYEKLFLVEGRPWLTAEQLLLLSSSCQQTNLISRAILFSRESQVRHFPGVVQSWSEKNNKADGNLVLGVMDLSSLSGWVLFPLPYSSRTTSWLCCPVVSSVGLW